MPPDVYDTNKPGAQQDAFSKSGLAEDVRQRRRRGSNALWGIGLALSVVLHVLILMLLSGVRIGGGGVAVRAPIEIDTDLIEEFQPERVSMPAIIKMKETAPAEAQSAALAKQLKSPDTPAPAMSTDELRLEPFKQDLMTAKKKPSAGRRWASGKDLTGRIRRADGGGYAGAMDAVAVPIIGHLAKGSVTVVILFDTSRSLTKERAVLAAQLERTFYELKFAVAERQARRLKWAVVSYGERPAVALKPTRSVKKVKQALSAMPIEDSGTENVLKAVRFCLEEFGRTSRRTIIMLMTDEQGDDLGINGKTPTERNALKRMVEVCKRRKASVFVLGRESFMHRRGSYLWMMQDGVNKLGFQHLGYPNCKRELGGPIHYADIAASQLPSGFGSYGLSVLAHNTGGAFFVVTGSKSNYKARRLQPYAPEICYPPEYNSRVKASSLRRALYDISGEISAFPVNFHYKYVWGSQRPKWIMLERHLKNKIEWCDQSIRRLTLLKDAPKREKYAPKRWEANYDLTLAQLYKLKATLLEYRVALKRLLKKRPPLPRDQPKGTVPQYALGLVSLDDKTAVFSDSREVRDALEKAKQALELVIAQHEGTPWATEARHELVRMRSVTASASYTPRQDPPPPPKIGL